MLAMKTQFELFNDIDYIPELFLSFLPFEEVTAHLVSVRPRESGGDRPRTNVLRHIHRSRSQDTADEEVRDPCGCLSIS